MGNVKFGSQFQVISDQGSGLSQLSTLGQQATQSADGFVYVDQIIATAAHTALDLGSLTTLGRYRLRNADPTNAVNIGIDVAAAFHGLDRLLPGETSEGRFGAGVVPYAQFEAADGKLEVAIGEA